MGTVEEESEGVRVTVTVREREREIGQAEFILHHCCYV